MAGFQVATEVQYEVELGKRTMGHALTVSFFMVWLATGAVAVVLYIFGIGT
jgi:hypothetical protein